MYRLKEKDKAAFYFHAVKWVLPAASTKELEERSVAIFAQEPFPVRRCNYPLALRQMRSLVPWSNSPLTQEPLVFACLSVKVPNTPFFLNRPPLFFCQTLGLLISACLSGKSRPWQVLNLRNVHDNGRKNSVHVAPGGVENTRRDTCRRQLCLEVHYRQFYGSWFSDVNCIQTEGSERLDVEAPKKCPCPAACASLWRQPSLFWR